MDILTKLKNKAKNKVSNSVYRFLCIHYGLRYPFLHKKLSEQSDVFQQLLGFCDKISLVFNLSTNEYASVATENHLFPDWKILTRGIINVQYVVCMKARFWIFNFEI